MRLEFLLTASFAALVTGTPAFAQDSNEPAQTQSAEQGGEEEAIVITGVRASLERAADVKRNAVQVVDSIVATDIGKLPDPTTAAALQRVPGIQVSNDKNNELSGVRIRGLPDISTTVDGREVITATGRGFDLKDVAAESLARVDVFKSQTADQIEGGVAGAIDLRLNKPFNFRKPTLVLSARQNYALSADEARPQFGVLATDRFDTGAGEIGILVNGSYSEARAERAFSSLTDRRSSGVAPLNAPGYLIPQVIQNMPDIGDVKRAQVNGSIQWQATPSLQAYVDGLYTYFESTSGFAGFNPQPFTTNSPGRPQTSITDIVASNDCFDARVNANGTNPTVSVIPDPADPTKTISVLQPATVQRVCDIKSARFNNIVINQNSSSRTTTQDNMMFGGGLKFEQGPFTGTVDAAYQTSSEYIQNVNAEVGQRVSSLLLETDVDQGMRVTIDPSIPLSSANLSLRNQFNQNFTLTTGKLFQARADGNYEIDSFLKKISAGVRYSDRKAIQRDVQQTNPIANLGFGNVGTASEANARLVSSLPVSSDFLGVIGYAPRLNGGTEFLGVSPAYLRSERGRNELRAMFGLPLRRPDWDPTRQFDASERTLAGYVQGAYEFNLGGITLDGVVGVRVINTDRTISTNRRVAGVLTPVTAETNDLDVLPAATLRAKLAEGLQTRLTYSRSMRRPEFGSLNPTLSLVLVGNPLLLNSGNAGNPDLRPQKSDSFDATAEYYFKSGAIAITAYYRSIKDRVINSVQKETIEGIEYNISRPRNVGQAELKGIEASGQYFFDFLPGALSGFGVMGAFTYADTKIKGSDQLAGYALQGVSKYNYTAGLIYDKAGLSGRLIYTHRSSYYDADISGAVQLRPYDTSRPVTDAYVPVLLQYVRPAGRLDFSVGYDVTEQLRIDVGGTNILRNYTRQYRGEEYLNGTVFGDETTYTIGARIKF